MNFQGEAVDTGQRSDKGVPEKNRRGNINI
jgi:hypothetical protein